MAWLQKAADQGSAAGEDGVGLLYARGLGVAKDEAKALEWFKKAGYAGDANAQVRLAAMYETGQGGVTKDDKEAVKWWRWAADEGDLRAELRLGELYGAGRGVAADPGEAVRWRRKAAEAGYAPAQFELGARYIDLSSATTPAACSSWAPASAVAAASSQARKRR